MALHGSTRGLIDIAIRAGTISFTIAEVTGQLAASASQATAPASQATVTAEPVR